MLIKYLIFVCFPVATCLQSYTIYSINFCNKKPRTICTGFLISFLICFYVGRYVLKKLLSAIFDKSMFPSSVRIVIILTGLLRNLFWLFLSTNNIIFARLLQSIPLLLYRVTVAPSSSVNITWLLLLIQ